MIVQRRFTTGENQHVTHLAFEVMQAILQLSAEAHTMGFNNAVGAKMPGVQSGCRQWRADLVSQRSHHLAHGRQLNGANQRFEQRRFP